VNPIPLGGIPFIKPPPVAVVSNLHIVKVLLISPTVFISRQPAPELKSFGQMMEGALFAKRFQLITMNADVDAKKKILPILPALKSPTICCLEDGGFSVSTVVEISSVADLLLKLKLYGATDIIGTDINFAIK